MFKFAIEDSSQHSALLSNARSTIATLIQRPSTITTSNAFDEFSILDHLIDVSNDVDRFEDAENRKFVNIAQLITASTCIYSRRVDALYKLINNFQTSSTNDDVDVDHVQSKSFDSDTKMSDEKPKKTKSNEIKKKTSSQQRSFICQDLNKINISTSKSFFVDRSSLIDLKLFQNFVPMANKQFWITDERPVIFDLMFDTPTGKELINEKDQMTSESLPEIFNDEPLLPIPVSIQSPTVPEWSNENFYRPETFSEKKTGNRQRTKPLQNKDPNLNVFRTELSDDQQALLAPMKRKSTSIKSSSESITFFDKVFRRRDLDELIGELPSSIRSLFVYPSINQQHFTVRQRYSEKINSSESERIRSPLMSIAEVLHSDTIAPIDSPHPRIVEAEEQDDLEIRLETDMKHYLDVAFDKINDEQKENEIFLKLRSKILNYLNEHQPYDLQYLIDSLYDQYSLPLIFSQLLHICASTQNFSLHSTNQNDLILQKH